MDMVVKRAKQGHERLLDLERQACDRIEHPNVVRYLGAATSDDRGVLLAFERLDPNPLLFLNNASRRPRYRDRGTTYIPLPPGCGLELAFDLLLALEHLHARNLVHADVKLGNLLMRTHPGKLPAREPLVHTAEGDFEGVLVDLGSVRSMELLAALASGDEDPVLSPHLTPIYAPPEALFERKELGNKKVIGPTTDIDAFGLVLYVLLTGRLPYEGVVTAEKLKRPDDVLELKIREAHGHASPVNLTTLDVIPLHDVAFHGPAARLWPSFRSAVGHVLTRCLAPEPSKRPTASEVRAYFEEELRFRPTSERARGWRQDLFQMRPSSNRLVERPAMGGLTITGEDDELVVEEGKRWPEPPPVASGSLILVEGSSLVFRPGLSAAQVKTTSPSGSKVLPRGMSRLADLLREVKAGREPKVEIPSSSRPPVSTPRRARPLHGDLAAAPGRANAHLRDPRVGVATPDARSLGRQRRRHRRDVGVEDLPSSSSRTRKAGGPPIGTH